jgi:hypothetical protein
MKKTDVPDDVSVDEFEDNIAMNAEILRKAKSISRFQDERNIIWQPLKFLGVPTGIATIIGIILHFTIPDAALIEVILSVPLIGVQSIVLASLYLFLRQKFSLKKPIFRVSMTYKEAQEILRDRRASVLTSLCSWKEKLKASETRGTNYVSLNIYTEAKTLDETRQAIKELEDELNRSFSIFGSLGTQPKRKSPHAFTLWKQRKDAQERSNGSRVERAFRRVNKNANK